jgi:hypothetical protein
MKLLLLACASAGLAAALGCSAAGSTFMTGAGATGGAGSGTGGMANLGGGFATVGTGAGGGLGQGCTEAATLVYVLTTAGDIYSFAPDMKTFTYLATPNCADPSLGANSMAIDRNVVAWINYVAGDDSEGWIYRYDLVKKKCVGNPIQMPLGWERLGMGFSTDTAGGSSETLFVTATNGVFGLGKVDMSNDSIIQMPGQFNGDTNLDGQNAELTGTGDARLYGFFTTNPVRVAQIDKGTAKILSDAKIAGVPTPGAWAFSFWGGSFYLYTSDGTQSSTVTKFDPTNGSVDTSYVPSSELNFTIDGAGVSTCAPVVPPT